MATLDQSDILRFDAVALLHQLTNPPCPREIGPDDLPGDWRIEFEERAAIREYEAGQAREHAEAEALREILSRMSAGGVDISQYVHPES